MQLNAQYGLFFLFKGYDKGTYSQLQPHSVNRLFSEQSEIVSVNKTVSDILTSEGMTSKPRLSYLILSQNLYYISDIRLKTVLNNPHLKQSLREEPEYPLLICITVRDIYYLFHFKQDIEQPF